MPLVAEAHTAGLFATYSAAPDTRGWTYLGDAMPVSEAAYQARLEAMETSQDPLFHVVLDRASGETLGIASYLRIDPGNDWFYPATLGLAVVWTIGAFLSGPLHLGRTWTGRPVLMPVVYAVLLAGLKRAGWVAA